MAPFAGGQPANQNDDFAAEIAGLRRELYLRALFLAQDSFAADDLVQEAIERALLARARFQRGTHLEAWLGQILRNLFIDARRRALTRARFEQEGEIDEATAAPSGGIFDVLSGDDVASAVGHLEAAQREVFMLACLEGLTYQEIAARIGVPVSTVGTRLLRAKRKVRGMLEQVYEDRVECRGNA
jgi:RNA polymerase sigma-70 factor, ECF subfamily